MFANALPNVRPQMYCNFRKRRSIPPSMSVMRDSTSMVFNQNGVLEALLPREPTLSFHPFTKEFEGWEMSPAIRNYCVDSSLRSSAAYADTLVIDKWLCKNSSIANAEATRFDVDVSKKLLATNAGSACAQYFSVITYASALAFRILVKKGSSGDKVTLRLAPSLDGVNYTQVTFDFTTKALSFSYGGAELASFASYTKHTVQEMGDGWFALELVSTFLLGSQQRITASVYVGVPGSAAAGDDVLVCAAQMQSHTSCHAYIPTNGISVTRAMEYGLFNGFDISQEGTVVIEVKLGNQINADTTLFSFNDPSGGQVHALDIRYVPAAGQITTRQINQSVQKLTRHTGVYNPGEVIKVVMSYSPYLLQGAINGGDYKSIELVGTTIPLSVARFGLRGLLNNPFAGFIRSFAYYNCIFSREQAIALSRI